MLAGHASVGAARRPDDESVGFEPELANSAFEPGPMIDKQGPLGLSVTARPRVGKARHLVSTSAWRLDGRSPLPDPLLGEQGLDVQPFAGSTSVSRIDCWQVNQAGVPNAARNRPTRPVAIGGTTRRP